MALKTCLQGLELASELDNRAIEATFFNDIGVIYRNLGDYSIAVEYLQRALAIRERHNDRAGMGQTLHNLAVVDRLRGDYAAALSALQRALAIVREREDFQGKAFVLNSLGETYRGLGQYRQAIAQFEQALAIARQHDIPLLEAAILSNLGASYDDIGNERRAIDFYRQGLQRSRAIGDRQGVAQTLINLGVAYERSRDYQKARQFYRQGLEAVRAIGDTSAEAQALNNLGSIFRQQGNYPQALEYYNRALQLRRALGEKAAMAVTLNNIGVAQMETDRLDRATDNLYRAIEILESLRPGLKDSDRVALFDRRSGVYRVLQQVSIARDRPEAALEIAERGRARAFVELLAQRLPTEDIPQPVPPPTIDRIRQIARDRNATLVEYSLIRDSTARDRQLYIWVVKPSGEVTFRSRDLSGVTSPFREIVSRTRDALQVDLSGVNARKIRDRQLRQLHELLIAPIADLLPRDPDDRVIFIPQDELLLVPFAALKDAGGEYAIERHTILTAPAIQVLSLVRDRPQRDRSQFLVVGHPEMPVYQTPDGESYQPRVLPETQTEAIAIGRILDSEALLGDRASETEVVRQISQASIVHLATHGSYDYFGDSEIPGAIALAPTSRDDGWLTGSEILNLDLNGALVVLSACNTAPGRLSGDGVIGLSRSFLSAGASSVILSLWRVEDAPTVPLMTEFYRQLQQGQARSAALRQAMLATMQEFPDPKIWGTFILVGID